MTRRDAQKSLEITRPIRTKRDYEGARAVVKKISGKAAKDSAAERRMQALLKELDRFDESEDDADAPDLDYSGPRRRWSDGGPGDEE
jgi:hypothetical protein